MEPQEVKYCCIDNHKQKKDCKCLGLIIGILVALFLATLGLILGAVFVETLIANIAVLILGAVLLGIGIILTIIFKECVCSKKKCCY